ncbi:MAG: bifunctional helix-turn-helix domain-containing protein/methylated-DNA--[protein]-cysteine S-methyltransferase [Chloroflexi bacterium]|nr:bifunctional helix-turn-helix domain-containing protein/methylated-DNA--[protein]-cysteine S-methyltransferase [Chloroflexota bacterium]
MMVLNMVDYQVLSEDYERVEQALCFLEQHVEIQPSLKDVAENVHLSEFHFQKLFTRWVGISPKRFLQYLTKERAKSMLASSRNLLETAYSVGLSGPGRLHDLFVACEAVTPGEFKRQGEDLTIYCGFHPSPFGECLLAVTERGVCSLIFVMNGDREAAYQSLCRSWPLAELVEDREKTRPYIRQIFARLSGLQDEPLNLYLRGTNFQIKVWEALLRIPPGSVVTYQDIAMAIGMPRAARAVGNAVGQNPVPVLIPCHRVIRKNGDFGDYGYGSARKKALLGWEQVHAA